ncbi:MAG: tetratricopeptide repeat protein [Phycisphaerales bacterium]
MAKVNHKFLFILTGGILAAVVSAVAVKKIAFKSPEENVREAREFADKGDYGVAAIYIGKAVSKEQANIEYLTIWRDYLLKYAPKDQTRASDAFTKLRNALTQLAVVQRVNVKAQRELLDLAWSGIEANGEYANYNILSDLVAQTEQMLSYHEGSPDGEWQTIERYRGWALTNMTVASQDTKQQLIDQAKKSLDIAAKADPKDVRTALKTEELYWTLARRAEAATKPEEAILLDARAESTLDGFLASNPESPEALLRKLQRGMDAEVRALLANADPEDREQRARRTVEVWNARLGEILELTKAGKYTCADRNFRGLISGIEKRFMPGSGFNASKALYAKLIADSPADPDLLLELSALYADSNDFAKAISTMDSLLALPPATVSMDSVRLFDLRTEGVYLQTLWMIKSADEPGIAKEERLKRETAARDLKTKLEAMVDSDSAPLLKINAYIAFMDRKFEESGRFIDRFHAKTRNQAMEIAGDADSNWLNGLVQLSLNKPGEAYKAFSECLRFDARNVQAALRMASIDAQLQNYDRALEIVNQILTLAPGYEEAQNIRQSVLMAKGEKVSDDPVINSLLGADQMTRELMTDPDGLRKIEAYLIAECAKFKDDYRIVRALGLLYLRMGERDKAIAQLEKAIASNPDDVDSKALLSRAKSGNSLEGDLASIDANTGADDIMKALMKVGAYRRAGRKEDAGREMEKARAINANDPRVIEIDFVNAIDDNELDRAATLAQTATEQNIDGRNGLTFRARVASANGQFAEAATMLQQAVSLGNPSPEIYRMLGRAQAGAGNAAESVKQFELALQARPNDPLSINDLMIAYMQANRQTEALNVARQGEKFAGDNPAFRNLYNLLESQVGNKSLALARRERVASMDPNDRRNFIELTLLYLDFERWTDAERAIASAAKISEDIDLVGLRTEVLWRQNRKDDGRKIFTDHIAKLEGEPAMRATMAYAEFLLRKEEINDAIAVLKGARSRQDPKVMGVEIVLLDLFFSRGMFAEAAESCKALIDAKLDVDNQYLKRYAECLTRSGSHEAALKAIESISQPGNEDMPTLLIKAEASGGLGKPEDQRRYLDEAVTRFPNQSLVFRQRGAFLLSRRYDDAQEQRRSAADAKEDFDQALRLKPDDYEVLRLRALAHVAADPERGLSAAIEDSRAALRLNPDNTDLLFGLLADLIRFDRISEALVVAEENLARKPDDKQMLSKMGELFAQFGRPMESVRFFRAAFDADRKDAVAAQNLIDALFNMDPPGLSDAEGVLEQAKSMVDRNPGLLMARARILLSQGRFNEADKVALTAVKLLDPQNSRQMLAWFNDIKKTQPDPKRQLAFLQSVESLGVGAEVAEWFRFLRANIRMADPTTLDAGIEEIRKLTTDAKLAAVNQMAFRFLGGAYYSAGKYAEAAQTWEAALKKYPGDSESGNNLAYTLLKHLDRKADALTIAEAAAKALVASPDVQDTYGLALLANGKTGEAIAALRNAVMLSSTTQSEVTTRVHLAQALIAGGDENEARAIVRAAMMTMSEPNAVVSESTKADLEAIKKALGL